MATDPPDSPGEPPVEDTDTSASPPENTAAPAKAAPLDDVVASLIEEKPRPHLTVVPPPKDGDDEPVEDPLAAVLDQGAPAAPAARPEPVADENWTPGDPIPDGGVKVDLGKLLELGGLTGGLQKITGWIEKQLPGLNAAVGNFLKSVEVVINASDAFPVPGAKPAGSAPPLTIVPDEPELKMSDDIQTPTEPGPGEPTPVGDPQPEPTPGPPDPAPDPQPDPAPVRDPEPMPDPNPGNDPLPIHDPPPPLEDDPGRDPLPIGDPIGDPAPMRDPVITGSGTGEAKQTEPESDPDPIATD